MKTNETATEYKMRAECLSDANIIKGILTPWLRYFDVENLTTEHKGRQYQLPDVEVEFGINPGGPTLAEIQSLLASIEDCHVAEETVACARDFTGVRVPLEVTDSLPVPPSPERMKLVCESVTRLRDCLQIEQSRVERAIRTLLECADSEGQANRDRSGFIAIMEHKPTGMKSIRRIANNGGSDPVQARLALLQS